MRKREEALVILMEECGELIQACSKMIRSNGNKAKYQSEINFLGNLQDEVGDVVTLIEVLKTIGLVNDKQIEDRIKVKKEKLMKWSTLYD